MRIKLDNKLQRFKFYDKFEGNGRSQRKATRQSNTCSSCLDALELAVKFRFTQLRNFGRQSKRLKNKMIQIGNILEILNSDRA